jgi:hypothetical protein
MFDAMRVNSAVTSFEVAAQAMRDKGLDPENDKPTRTDFVRRASLAVGDMHRKGKSRGLDADAGCDGNSRVEKCPAKILLTTIHS